MNTTTTTTTTTTTLDPKNNTGEAPGSFFLDSPDAKNYMSNLSLEEQAQHRNSAETFYGKNMNMYENIDFDSVASDGIPPQFKEGVAFTVGMLNSGMHPSMLKDNEKLAMRDVYGMQWYKKWGYTDKDLTEIVTPFSGVTFG